MAEIVVHFSKEVGDADDCITYSIWDTEGNYLDDGCACEYDEVDYMLNTIIQKLDNIILEEG